MPDPNQNNNNNQSVNPTAGPPFGDTPPLPPDFQGVDPNSAGLTQSAPPVTSAVNDVTPLVGSGVQSQNNSGSAAPEDTLPLVTPPKKKFGGGRVIATIMGLFLLVGGVGAGIALINQKQLFEQKAALLECFPAGTKISTANGQKNIEDIESGNKVSSEDASGVKSLSNVTKLHKLWSFNMCSINFENGDTLKLTNPHPLYTTEGWKAANVEEAKRHNPDLDISQLSEGDFVKNEDGSWSKISTLSCKPGLFRVYNLTVDTNHNYFAERYLAHNKGGVTSTKQSGASGAGGGGGTLPDKGGGAQQAAPDEAAKPDRSMDSAKIGTSDYKSNTPDRSMDSAKIGTSDYKSNTPDRSMDNGGIGGGVASGNLSNVTVKTSNNQMPIAQVVANLGQDRSGGCYGGCGSGQSCYRGRCITNIGACNASTSGVDASIGVCCVPGGGTSYNDGSGNYTANEDIGQPFSGTHWTTCAVGYTCRQTQGCFATTGTGGGGGGGGTGGGRGSSSTPPSVTASCSNITVRNMSGEVIPQSSLSLLKANDNVRLCVNGASSQGSFDKGRFKINNGAFIETTANYPNGLFCLDYRIPANGVRTFTIKSEIHHTSLGWRSS